MTVRPFSSSAKLPSALADASWPAHNNRHTAWRARAEGARTCDVVCLAALHEHGDGAHVEQLRARLHVEREVGQRCGGADGHAAAADFEVRGFEEFGKEAVTHAQLVPDGSWVHAALHAEIAR